MARRGGATTINNRCWTMWAWKNSMVKVATGDCRARSKATSPDRKETVRFRLQLASTGGQLRPGPEVPDPGDHHRQQHQ